MDFSELEAFVAVMDSGSVSEAATQLHLTQPAVSRRIQALEASLSTSLFDRVGKRLHPTQQSEALLPRARALLTDRSEARRAIADLASSVSGKLRIATSHHIGLHRLAPVLKDFNRTFREVELDIRFEDSEAAHEFVRLGHCDLAIATLDPAGARDLDAEEIWPDPLVFVTASEHPLAAQHEVSLNDLAVAPAILPGTATYTGRIVAQAFASAGLTINSPMRTNYLETIGMLVAAGMGWSVLPATLLRSDLASLAVSETRLARQLGCITNPMRTLSNAANAFIDTVRRHRASHTL